MGERIEEGDSRVAVVTFLEQHEFAWGFVPDASGQGGPEIFARLRVWDFVVPWSLRYRIQFDEQHRVRSVDRGYIFK
ncbi:MAG: hypothetical protein R3F33_12150 [Planctomycetota bacterium]